MGKPGIIAFPVLIALAAITGYLTYTYFPIPQEGLVESPYRQELSAAAGNETDTGKDKVVDESKFSKVVTIRILPGAAAQGSLDYDPDAATASSDALVTWINSDTTLHTATSGEDTDDSEVGELFDSEFIAPNGKYGVPAADMGSGEHAYHCTLHPYMKGTITVQ